MMTEPEFNICGGAHSSCTKCIAWIQIVLNTVAFVVIVIVIIFFNDKAQTYLNEKKSPLPFNWLTVSITLGFILTPDIIFAVILLIGGNKRNPRYLRCWIIHTIIYIILVVCYIFANLTKMTVPLISLGWNFYGLWVVRKFKAELLQIPSSIEPIDHDPERIVHRNEPPRRHHH